VTTIPKRILEASTWVSAVRNAAWVTGALAVPAAAIIYFANGFAYARIGALGVLICIVSAAAGAALQRSRTTQSRQWGYRTISVTYSYSFDRREFGRQRQEVSTVIEATRPGVTLYEAKYRWSGNGDCRLSVTTPGQILLVDPRMTYGGWTYYYVRLLRPLTRGEKAEIKVVQEVDDLDRRMDFQLTKTIRENLDELVLKISFPANGPVPGNIWAVERRSILNDADVKNRLDVDYDAERHTAVLRVTKPTRGRTYAIEWLWPSYRQATAPRS
jgi:hypothetical protein